MIIDLNEFSIGYKAKLHMKYSVFSCLVLFLTLLFSCNTDQVALPDASTLEMAAELEKIYSEVDATKISYYLNKKRAESIKKEIPLKEGVERLGLEISYALEILNTGDSEQAIDLIKNALKDVEDRALLNKSQVITRLEELLAISYMRLGEQENCIATHNAASCIIPIAKEAVHQKRRGSEKAIEVYTTLLRKNPDDYQSRWLLNIAHMTLGQYPDEVPKEWLINIPQQKNLKKFRNVAISSKSNIFGLSGGTCVDDFNNDGLLDIVATSWGFTDQLRILFNNGDGTFDDVTDKAKITGLTGGLNILHTDYNNDGWLDIFVLRGAWLRTQGKHPNSLLRNNGDGTFTDVTKETGLLSYRPTQTGVWADFNMDGWLDLFIANESSDDAVFLCELYLNHKGERFEEVSTKVGINTTGYFKGVAAGDLNNDGLPDLYLSNYSGINVLFQNSRAANEHGIFFKNVVHTAGVQVPVKSFPTWIWDVNNDGHQDIFVSGYGSGQFTAAFEAGLNHNGQYVEGRPYFYINNGNGTFTDAALDANLKESVWTMGSNFGDINNDGLLDMYLGTGDPSFSSIVPNKMYLNLNGTSFTDITYSEGFGHIQKGHGIGFGDMDNDGDQDIYCVMGGAYEGDVFQNVLYENQFGDRFSWITLKLIGTKSNRPGIGARIKITCTRPDGVQVNLFRTVGTGGSFGNNSIQQEIGLGDVTRIDEILIWWPTIPQITTSIRNVPVNQFIEITEGVDQFKQLDMKSFRF